MYCKLFNCIAILFLQYKVPIFKKKGQSLNIGILGLENPY